MMGRHFSRRARGVLAGLAACAAFAVQGATTSYVVLSQGKPAGRQVVELLPGNRIKVEYTYRDNGRGPDIFEEVTLGASGQVEKLVTTGKSTFGAPIDETFSRKDGRAQWKSKADRGEKDGVASAIYLPVENSIELMAIATRAVLKAPGRKLAALPNGQVAAQKLLETPVQSGARRGRAALYMVTGVGVSPGYIWLWADKGAGDRLLGMVFPSFYVLESGWEAVGDELLKLQVEADAKTLAKLAGTLATKSDAPTVFRNVRWFDADKAAMVGPADVHVWRGRIAAVFPPNSPVADKVTEVDGSGKYLVPGLFDMHGHTSAWDSVLHLAGGVTTLRDMGNDNAYLNDLKGKIDSGRSLGPTIVPAGYIEGRSPHSSNGGFVIENVEEGRKAIDWYAQHGYRQVKLYNSIRPEWVADLAAHAHARGIRVSGHIPAFMRAEEAVRAGFDEIQHINQVVLNFLVKKDDDTRTLLRFYLVGDNTHLLDLDGEKVRDFIRLLVEKKTVIDPTLTAFEAMFLQRQGAPNPSFNMVSPHMPPAIGRSWLTNSMDVTDKNAEPFRRSYEKLLALVKRLHDAGVPIVAGSDDIAGFTLHRELELYVQAGLSPAEVLRIATLGAARVAQVADRTGAIAVGKDADLLLLDADPTADISAVRRAGLVMKGGVIHYPAEIYEALGVKPFAAKATVRTAK